MCSVKYRFFCVFLFILFGFKLLGFEGEYKFEGIYREPDGERRLFLVAFYLPYNPTILAYSDPLQGNKAEEKPVSIFNPEHMTFKCSQWWPKGTVFTDALLLRSANLKCDFFWVDSEGSELDILESSAETLKDVSVIYTTTHLQDNGAPFQKLKFCLELLGFRLLSHWYKEGQKGHAIFLRQDIFDISLKSLNYSPQASYKPLDFSFSNSLEQFFQPAENKIKKHSMSPIDFIYMINLDERPEKFALSAGNLHLYGIYPYRFSAVNGWKLSTADINRVGVKFNPDKSQEKFMASIFKEIDGVQCLSNGFIEKTGETYFAIGMSRGAVGIILSHLSILHDAYNSGYDTIWVMEDDAEIVDDPRQIFGLIQKLDNLVDDWDILFTDTDTKDTTGRHVPCRALAARPNFQISSLSSFFERFYPISDDFSRTGMRYGAYSMIVRRSGMRKILNYYKTYGIYLPYDLDYWLIPDLKMYTVNKDIVSHRTGAPSDNSEPKYLQKKTH